MDPEIEKMEKDLLIHLILLRSNTAIVPTYGADIPLETEEFTSANFSTDEDKKYKEIIKTLEGIKKDDLEILGYTTIKRLQKNDGEKIITIQGASTIKLYRYMQKRLSKKESLFGSTRYNNSIFITFMDDRTRVKINKEQLAILKYLKEHQNQYVTYTKLINILKHGIIHGNTFIARHTSNESEATYFISNNYIRPLRDKLNKASKNIFKKSKYKIISNSLSDKEISKSGLYKLQM